MRPAPTAMARAHFLSLPVELQLRVLEEVGGADLCAIDCVCPDLRRLLAGNGHVYARALAREYGPPKEDEVTSWKAAYARAVVHARLEKLERQTDLCKTLKDKVEELDGLLQHADEVKEQLCEVPDLQVELSPAFLFIGDMQQDVLQQRWVASEDLMTAEADMQVLQREVKALLARVPRSWWQVAAGCTIA